MYGCILTQDESVENSYFNGCDNVVHVYPKFQGLDFRRGDLLALVHDQLNFGYKNNDLMI